MDGQLAAYLQRIGFAGQAGAPSLPVLSGLVAAHMRTIPFENLDVLVGRPIALDLDAVVAKLVGANRGGYCFEHATLFAAMLSELGFTVSSHLARVVLAGPRDAAPLTHMFNLVTLPEGRFVVDPGFGGPAACVPVLLAETGAQAAGHWLAQEDGEWVLRTRLDGQVTDLWVTALTPDRPVDFAVSSHFVATHPGSIFVQNLMLNRFTEGGRVSVMNDSLSVVEGDRREMVTIPSAAALSDALGRHFGIDLPAAEQIRVPALPAWE